AVAPAARRPGSGAVGGGGGAAVRRDRAAPAADRPRGRGAAQPDDPPGGLAVPVAGGGEPRPRGVRRARPVRRRPVGQPPPGIRRGSPPLSGYDACPARVGGFARAAGGEDAAAALRRGGAAAADGQPGVPRPGVVAGSLRLTAADKGPEHRPCLRLRGVTAASTSGAGPGTRGRTAGGSCRLYGDP